MPDIPQPIVSADAYRHFGPVLLDQSIGHGQHVGRHASPHIKGVPVRGFFFEPEDGGIYNIVNIDKIPRFSPVLKDVDRVAVLDPGREDGEYSGIRIGERLARPVDVLVPVRDGCDPDGRADAHHELFLHLFGDPVD